MKTFRVEALSDGVIAIIITIMVLELKIPSEASENALMLLLPKFLSYTFSFLLIAIMWINHHHVFYNLKQVNGKLMWANIHLLFWMSLIPFATAYIGENLTKPIAVALYGLVLAASVIAFTILRHVISKLDIENPELEAQHKKILRKNLISNALYLISIPFAFVSVYISFLIFILVPALYFMPENKLEEVARKEEE